MDVARAGERIISAAMAATAASRIYAIMCVLRCCFMFIFVISFVSIHYAGWFLSCFEKSA